MSLPGRAGWNVVVTLRGREGHGPALRELRRFGRVRQTRYYNVVLMKVDDPAAFLDALEEALPATPVLRESVGRAIPLERTFVFKDPAGFEQQADELAHEYAPRLQGKAFHVRVHRRGFAGRMSGQAEEQRLDHLLLDDAARAGAPGRITFDDPDAVLVIETIDRRAGAAVFQRDEIARHPLLHVD